MRNFKQLKIWQKGIDIAVKTIQYSKSLPQDIRFELGSQINKAAISIPSNIAEGSSRKSDRDYHRFVEISLGSSFELETQLIIAERCEYGNTGSRILLLKEITEEQSMLSAFLNRLNNS